MVVQEVALYLRSNRHMVLRLIKDEGLPAVKVGRRWHFFKHEIDEWRLTRRAPHNA